MSLQRYTIHIKICVANTGRKYSEDQLEKIFERYYQVANQTEGYYNWEQESGCIMPVAWLSCITGHIKASVPDEEVELYLLFILPVNDCAYTEDERVSRQTRQSDIFPLDDEYESDRSDNHKLSDLQGVGLF